MVSSTIKLLIVVFVILFAFLFLVFLTWDTVPRMLGLGFLSIIITVGLYALFNRIRRRVNPTEL